MNDEYCEIDHTGEVPDAVIETLPKTQKEPFRHRCAACAYAAGLKEGVGDAASLAKQVAELTTANDKLRAELEAARP